MKCKSCGSELAYKIEQSNDWHYEKIWCDECEQTNKKDVFLHCKRCGGFDVAKYFDGGKYLEYQCLECSCTWRRRKRRDSYLYL